MGDKEEEEEERKRFASEMRRGGGGGASPQKCNCTTSYCRFHKIALFNTFNKKISALRMSHSLVNDYVFELRMIFLGNRPRFPGKVGEVVES